MGITGTALYAIDLSLCQIVPQISEAVKVVAHQTSFSQIDKFVLEKPDFILNKVPCT